MKIKDMPLSERPRERLIKYGKENLSNTDLLSIILRTGTKDNNVTEISNKILNKIDDIQSLDDITIQELTSINGMGLSKSITLLAALELGKRVNNKNIKERILLNNSDLIHNYFSNLIGFDKQENLLVILLDNKGRLINYQIMYKGTSTSSNASIKEIFNYAIKQQASGIILMHNHPSGIINPSKQDIDLTNRLIKTGEIIGINILDHLITNGKEYYSFFKEMNKINV